MPGVQHNDMARPLVLVLALWAAGVESVQVERVGAVTMPHPTLSMSALLKNTLVGRLTGARPLPDARADSKNGHL